MKDSYRRWMHDWETRMTSRDDNRVVRPFEWGSEFVSRWPVVADMQPPKDETDTRAMLEFWTAVNDRIIANSDEFYAYKMPTDFRLEHRRVELFHTGSEPPKKQLKESYGQFLRFTSAVESPYPENNLMNARWFPARGHRAVIVMPQWNADAISHNGLCQIFNMLGISALRMSMPYHDIRRPPGSRAPITRCRPTSGAPSIRCGRASPTFAPASTGCSSADTPSSAWSAPAWARVTPSSPPRTTRASASTSSTTPPPHSATWRGRGSPPATFAQSVEAVLTHDELRHAWMAISPIVYFDKFQRWPKKSLMIYGRYDLTFLPEFSMQAAGEFVKRGIDTTVKALPCGHYSLGETPYKYMDAWHISRFLSKAFAG